MKHIPIEDVPDRPVKKSGKTYEVETPHPFSKGLVFITSEEDQVTLLEGKTCSCGATLEYQLTHEFDHFRRTHMIGGPGYGQTRIYKRVKKVACPKCCKPHDMSIFEEWHKDRHPRRPGMMPDVEEVREHISESIKRMNPAPRSSRGRRRTDDQTRYRACVRT